MNSSNEPELNPGTRLGYVHLSVSDLERSIDFYQRSLGFRLQNSEGDTARLGAGEADLLVLTEKPGAAHVPGRSGLYHFAILLPSRPDLALALNNLIETRTALQGMSDHLVSEAVYLADPDGNGIEIYRDRPRSSWESVNGSLKMATLPLDHRGLLAELGDEDGRWNGLPEGTTLGHIHLHVAYISEAEAFYSSVLGFDVMVNIGSASFMSAGGYHHHIGVNIWNGSGAPPPPEDAVGLRYFTVNLANETELRDLISRLEGAGVPYEANEGRLSTRDPSQNEILFEVQA